MDIGILDAHIFPEFFVNNRLLRKMAVISNWKDRLSFDCCEIYRLFDNVRLIFILFAGI